MAGSSPGLAPYIRQINFIGNIIFKIRSLSMKHITIIFEISLYLLDIIIIFLVYLFSKLIGYLMPINKLTFYVIS